MYHTTGLTRDQIVDLCARAQTANDAARDDKKATWPPILGLFKSVMVTLTYLRRNRAQAEIGEAFNENRSQRGRHGRVRSAFT